MVGILKKDKADLLTRWTDLDLTWVRRCPVPDAGYICRIGTHPFPCSAVEKIQRRRSGRLGLGRGLG
jgi:hypothetical protein